MNIDMDELAAAIASKISQPIPVEIDQWDSVTIAKLLKVSPRQVTERLVMAPGFPKASRLPMAGGGRMQPRWKAAEVLTWISKNS